MSKKQNLYLLTAVMPTGRGFQEIRLLTVGGDERDAINDFFEKLPNQQSLRYLSRNPDEIKVSQIPEEKLAFWCREVLGVRA